VDAMLDLMPARRLVYHEWDAHGTCSGLGQRAYFDLIRRARGAVKIPQQFESPQQPLEVKPADVVQAFVKANPGLAAADIALDCDRSRLREVRICMTRDLKFRGCSADAERACRAASLRMPPVRGSGR
jgi:ribonuclease T2